MPRSRASDPPLYENPGRTYDTSEHLNLQKRHSKNVPIFAALGSAVQNRMTTFPLAAMRREDS